MADSPLKDPKRDTSSSSAQQPSAPRRRTLPQPRRGRSNEPTAPSACTAASRLAMEESIATPGNVTPHATGAEPELVGCGDVFLHGLISILELLSCDEQAEPFFQQHPTALAPVLVLVPLVLRKIADKPGAQASLLFAPAAAWDARSLGEALRQPSWCDQLLRGCFALVRQQIACEEENASSSSSVDRLLAQAEARACAAGDPEASGSKRKERMAAANMLVEDAAKQYSRLDLRRLLALMDCNRQQGSALLGKTVVLLLGPTGSGKSTLLHYLAGSTLQLTKVGGLDHYEVVRPAPGTEAVTTSAQGRSETSTLLVVQVTGPEGPLLLCDTPGTEDTHGFETSIANGQALTDSIHRTNAVLPVVVVRRELLTGERGNNLKALLKTISCMVEGIDSHLSCFFYVFTKAHNTAEEKLKINALIRDLLVTLDATGNELESLLAILVDMHKKTGGTVLHLPPFKATMSDCGDYVLSSSDEIELLEPPAQGKSQPGTRAFVCCPAALKALRKKFTAGKQLVALCPEDMELLFPGTQRSGGKLVCKWTNAAIVEPEQRAEAKQIVAALQECETIEHPQTVFRAFVPQEASHAFELQVLNTHHRAVAAARAGNYALCRSLLDTLQYLCSFLPSVETVKAQTIEDIMAVFHEQKRGVFEQLQPLWQESNAIRPEDLQPLSALLQRMAAARILVPHIPDLPAIGDSILVAIVGQQTDMRASLVRLPCDSAAAMQQSVGAVCRRLDKMRTVQTELACHDPTHRFSMEYVGALQWVQDQLAVLETAAWTLGQHGSNTDTLTAFAEHGEALDAYARIEDLRRVGCDPAAMAATVVGEFSKFLKKVFKAGCAALPNSNVTDTQTPATGPAASLQPTTLCCAVLQSVCKMAGTAPSCQRMREEGERAWTDFVAQLETSYRGQAELVRSPFKDLASSQLQTAFTDSSARPALATMDQLRRAYPVLGERLPELFEQCVSFLFDFVRKAVEDVDASLQRLLDGQSGPGEGSAALALETGLGQLKAADWLRMWRPEGFGMELKDLYASVVKYAKELNHSLKDCLAGLPADCVLVVSQLETLAGTCAQLEDLRRLCSQVQRLKACLDEFDEHQKTWREYISTMASGWLAVSLQPSHLECDAAAMDALDSALHVLYAITTMNFPREDADLARARQREIEMLLRQHGTRLEDEATRHFTCIVALQPNDTLPDPVCNITAPDPGLQPVPRSPERASTAASPRGAVCVKARQLRAAVASLASLCSSLLAIRDQCPRVFACLPPGLLERVCGADGAIAGYVQDREDALPRLLLGDVLGLDELCDTIEILRALLRLENICLRATHGCASVNTRSSSRRPSRDYTMLDSSGCSPSSPGSPSSSPGKMEASLLSLSEPVSLPSFARVCQLHEKAEAEHRDLLLRETALMLEQCDFASLQQTLHELRQCRSTVVRAATSHIEKRLAATVDRLRAALDHALSILDPDIDCATVVEQARTVVEHLRVLKQALRCLDASDPALQAQDQVICRVRSELSAALAQYLQAVECAWDCHDFKMAETRIKTLRQISHSFNTQGISCPSPACPAAVPGKSLLSIPCPSPSTLSGESPASAPCSSPGVCGIITLREEKLAALKALYVLTVGAHQRLEDVWNWTAHLSPRQLCDHLTAPGMHASYREAYQDIATSLEDNFRSHLAHLGFVGVRLPSKVTAAVSTHCGSALPAVPGRSAVEQVLVSTPGSSPDGHAKTCARLERLLQRADLPSSLHGRLASLLEDCPPWSGL